MNERSSGRRRLFYSLAVLCLVAAEPAHAQPRGGTVTGSVTDRTTGKALASAQIILLRDSRSILTDSVGAYAFKGLPAGVSQLLVRVPSFPAHTIIVELVDGQELLRPIVLDSTADGREAQKLAPVGVTAPAVSNYRLVDFERRRKTGRGQYLTDEEIVRSGANSISDAVRALRGVALDCRAYSCRIHMVRAPMSCFPDYVVDGRVDNAFGPSTPIRDIVAIEVYAGASDVPGEFAGRNAGCGVVVLWTRSGPPRRQ